MRVAIVGSGAAGMMCAATINELNPRIEVVLIEKNDSLGKKVIISGGGRCNVTTGLQDIKTVLKKYPRGEKFLTTAMYNFSPADVFAWFENHGTPLKCEQDLRVFPKSNNGKDVVKVFENIFGANNTKILFKHSAKNIIKKENKFLVYFNEKDFVEVDKVIMAVGGQAYRHTGSTGDGYTIAESLGHSVTALAPSLYSFITKEKWPREVSGLSFEKAAISFKGQKKYSFTGPFLFTHIGISGPAVFALSSLIAFEKFDQTNPINITLDLLPDLAKEKLLEKINKTIKDNIKKSFKNTLHNFLPLSLAEVVCRENNITFEKKNAEMSKSDINNIIKWIKQMPLTVIGRGAGDEFVTAGGVELSQVDTRTMESKICPGLYFVGEILDVDGFTGGFNLQASWATGRAAGRAIAV